MKKQPEGLKSTNSSPQAETETQDTDNNSTNFKIKNFTSETIENKKELVEDKKKKERYIIKTPFWELSFVFLNNSSNKRWF